MINPAHWTCMASLLVMPVALAVAAPQTTNGWMMGIHYAKALGHAYGYCHMAYWVWITTSECDL